MSGIRQTYNSAGAPVPAMEAQNYGRDLLHGLRKQMPDMADVTWLVKNGAALDMQDVSGDTALHLALRQQLRTIVMDMLATKPDVNIPNHSGNTPVIHAATGDNALLQAVINAGAHVNHANISGNTALACAIAAGKESNVTTLLAAGAAVNIKLLDMAQRLGRRHLLPQLKDAYDAQCRSASITMRDVPVAPMPCPRRPKPFKG